MSDIKDDKEKLEKLYNFTETEIPPSKEDDDEVDYKEQLPVKYRDVVRQIADNLNAGFICFFNPDTLELENTPKDLLGELGEDGEDCEANFGFKLTHNKWKSCLKIEPLSSRESFTIMEDFTNKLKNKKEARKLAIALEGRKPFANFNHIVNNSDYRKNWLDFRQKELEKYVIQNYFSPKQA
ncbi:MAG: UPF0158 family protein [Prevotellaceae bacterium]|nr:UPF0158 family protein [Prevotellaceae bacterium]